MSDTCKCISQAKKDKCNKLYLCDCCGSCMSWLGYSEDQTTCIECKQQRLTLINHCQESYGERWVEVLKNIIKYKTDKILNTPT